MAVDIERLAERLERPLGERVAAFGSLHSMLEDGELVTAEARHQFAFADVAAGARRLLEHLVAAGWPSVSLTSLNRSRSTECRAMCWPRRQVSSAWLSRSLK